MASSFGGKSLPHSLLVHQAGIEARPLLSHYQLRKTPAVTCNA
jgi:hypothetical protein